MVRLPLHFPPPALAIFLLTSMMFSVSCDRPEKSASQRAADSQPPVAEEIASTAADEEPEAPDRSDDAPASDTAVKETANEAPPAGEQKKEANPVGVLDLKRQGKDISLSGSIRSRYQLEDMVIALEQIPDTNFKNEMKVVPEVEGWAWGNRVAPLLGQLAASVENLHLHIEGGVIDLKGSVPDKRSAMAIQQVVVETLEDDAIHKLNNELKTTGN